MSLVDIFRYNIKYYRFLAGYSQEQLGEKSGISTHYVSDIEQGKYSPPVSTIERIAHALNIDAYKLFMDNPKAYHLPARIDIHRKK